MVTKEHFGTSTMTFTIRGQINLDKSAMTYVYRSMDKLIKLDKDKLIKLDKDKLN